MLFYCCSSESTVGMAVDFLTHCRSRLLMLDCPWVVQMSDCQLETWLLQPGPHHNQALMWALLKMDPDLHEYFQLIGEEKKPKEIVRLFVCSGLVNCTESVKVLGNAPRKELQSFWDSVLNQLCLIQEFKAADQDDFCHRNAPYLVSTLTSCSDFLDLLEKKPDLLPTDVMVPSLTVSIEDLKIQLAELEEQLTDAQAQSLCNKSNSVAGQSSLCSLETSSLRESESLQNHNNLRQEVGLQKKNIDDFYQKFVHQVVMVIKKSPQNPVAEQLAQVVTDLNSKVRGFIAVFENYDEMKRLETSLLSRTVPKGRDTLKDSLQEFISSVTEQTSLIINIINANKDVLGL